MTMREITSHKVNPANDRLRVVAIDTPAGEPAVYQIQGAAGDPVGITTLNFQLGPIKEVGLNGITNEVLLAIVRDRLDYFQRGAFSCRENACAITKLDEAMLWLHARTLRRMQQGTEGTNKGT